MNTCLAKTRSGGQCQRAGNPKNGRCHLHGGASTGPKTAEGRARIAAAQFKHGKRSKAFVDDLPPAHPQFSKQALTHWPLAQKQSHQE